MGSLRKALCAVAVAFVAMLGIAPQVGVASAQSPSVRATAVSAGTTAAPTPMTFACVSKATDLMSYVSCDPARCLLALSKATSCSRQRR
jgi:hypothetical protein